MPHSILRSLLIFAVTTLILALPAVAAEPQPGALIGRSIRTFGVLPENEPAENAKNLQAAIDWAAPRGAALFVEPSDDALSNRRRRDTPPERVADWRTRAGRTWHTAPRKASAGGQCVFHRRRIGTFSDRGIGHPGARHPVLVSAAAGERRQPDHCLSAHHSGIQDPRRSRRYALVPHLLRRVSGHGLCRQSPQDLRTDPLRTLLRLSAERHVHPHRLLLRYPAHPALSRQPGQPPLHRWRAPPRRHRRRDGEEDRSATTSITPTTRN